MNFLRDFRIKVSNYLISQKHKKQARNVVASNIKDVKSAAIIFDPNDAENTAASKKMEQFLKGNNISYKTLGMNCTKNVLENVIGDQTHLYVSKNDTSWYYQPKSDDLKDFTNKTFDVLFNLYNNECYEVEAIVKLSYAKFKIGTTHFNPQIHDLILEIDDNHKKADYIIEQMQHYITIINA